MKYMHKQRNNTGADSLFMSCRILTQSLKSYYSNFFLPLMRVWLEYEFRQGSKKEERKGEPSAIMDCKNEN